jgi:trans-L-3-hydroxyproline dehydratase
MWRSGELSWQPPAGWNTVTVIDSHAAGEPLRVIVDGLPALPGKTMLERRRFAQEHLDFYRKALMWEPRGHADMYGAIITQPASDDGDLGVLFLHNEGYSTMCGHGIIALTKVVLDTGIVRRAGDEPRLSIDSPAGRIEVRASRQGGLVKEVSFVNVPSFVYRLDQEIEAEGLGRVAFDVAFGGAFYAFCDARSLGLELTPESNRRLIEAGRSIKLRVAQQLAIEHPFERDLGFLYGTIFTGPAADSSHHSRNVCVFADGEVDRSPTGTGVSARSAIHHARGELEFGEAITIESILGTTFTVKILRTVDFGPYRAVVPEVSGSAFITGVTRYCFDPEDPVGEGFFLR